MQINKSMASVVALLFFTSASFGQTTTEPQSVPEAPKPVVEVQAPPKAATDSEKMQTLFSRMSKNGVKKVKYLGLSVGSEIRYGMLAGQFTPMAGTSVMLHINKKWGIGAAGYGTIDNSFAPTAINAAKLLSLRSGYGGLLFEYTPKPNAAIHVSFPLLIGAGMASVDSVSNRNNRIGFRRNGRNVGKDNYGMNGRGNNNGVGFVVIQPGINVEANVFRFAKIFVGASYRIVPSVMKEAATTTTASLPTPTASQLSGLNLAAGVRVGLFDYNLNRPKKTRTHNNNNQRDNGNGGNRRGFWGLGRGRGN
jgi:hypothetical protein